MKFILHRTVLIVFLLSLFPVLCAQGETASKTVSIETTKQENWLQRKVSAKLLQIDKDRDRLPDFGWKLKPGVAFRMKRKGMDWAIGPRIMLSKQISKDGKLTFNGSYLPLKFSDLKSGSQVNYSRFDIGYRHYLNAKLFAGFGYSLHKFSPSGELQEEVAARGGLISNQLISATSVSIGQQVFKIAWSYKGQQRIWPFFLELTYQFADDYEYGADLGEAGSQFKIKSGLSFRIRPLTRKF